MGGPTRLTFDFPPEPGASPRRRVFTEPEETLVARSPAEVREVLERVDHACAEGRWAAGYVGFEAAPAFDSAFRVPPGARWPLAWFGIFERAREPSGEDPGNRDTGGFPGEWVPSTSQDAYYAAIERIREAIGAGDVYQVNHTLRLRNRFTGKPEALHAQLRAAQGSGYHAHLDFDRLHVLSASPELFFQRRGTRITTRPMKGTRARGRWCAEDRAAAEVLQTSEKDRAENLMIVDLMRNDLGRIARTGSVRVPHMFDIERYRTVWQMTSTIEADAAPGTRLPDLFRALFPSGSVTGAPKIAAMKFIAALEGEPREAYCGAIGFVEPGGDCTFNVPIRTLLLDTETGDATYGAGGGITWDSTAEGEYEEALAKAAVLAETWPVFSLLETLRIDGVACRARRHAARLRDTAAYFGYPFDAAAVRAAISRAVAAVGPGTHRLRVLLDHAGRITTGTARLEPLEDAPRVAFARTPVDSRDRFLFHKTTNRGVYDVRRAERPDVFDVLLRNERSEITEFTVGNVVVEHDGERLTPPVATGLLAGTFRAEQLEAGRIRERVLYETDVRNASRVWLLNSVREWLEVRLED